MEAFDLPVGLRPVGARFPDFDSELGAGIAPEVGFVGGAVIGKDSFDHDAASRKPGHCPSKNVDRGGSGFVTVDLGIGDPGMVVDDGVNEAGPDKQAALVVRGTSSRGPDVPVALLASDESVTPAVWDLRDLLHVDVDHRAGMVMLVTANDLACSHVDSPATSGVDGSRRRSSGA